MFHFLYDLKELDYFMPRKIVTTEEFIASLIFTYMQFDELDQDDIDFTDENGYEDHLRRIRKYTAEFRRKQNSIRTLCEDYIKRLH